VASGMRGREIRGKEGMTLGKEGGTEEGRIRPKLRGSRQRSKVCGTRHFCSGALLACTT